MRSAREKSVGAGGEGGAAGGEGLRFELHVYLDADAHAAAYVGQLVEVNVADFGFVAVDQAKGGVLGGVEFGDEPRPRAGGVEQLDVDQSFVALAFLAVGLGA